jgi:hypothetical protein
MNGQKLSSVLGEDQRESFVRHKDILIPVYENFRHVLKTTLEEGNREVSGTVTCPGCESSSMLK